MKTTKQKNAQKSISTKVDKSKMSVQAKEKKRIKQMRKNELAKWNKLTKNIRYKRTSVRVVADRQIECIKDELFDGIILNLSEKYSESSYSVKQRALRRIVEKRQAQLTVKIMGRRKDRLAKHTVTHYSSKCMRMLYEYQHCM